MEPLATIEDTEAFLLHTVPSNLTDYEERKRGMASNTLRQLFAKQGDDLDKMVADSTMFHDLVRDTIAVSVAQDVRRKETEQESDTDLSSFSSFTQSAGGYTFTGEWRGNTDDVFFTRSQLKNLGVAQCTIGRFSL